MKKLAYLALALISVIALGSCKITVNPGTTSSYGDNYIKVEWYGGPNLTKPQSWYGTNTAIASSTESGTNYTQLRSYYLTEDGNFDFTYRDYNGNLHSFSYTISPNYSYYDKDYVLYLDTSLTNGGACYTAGNQPSESVGTVK